MSATAIITGASSGIGKSIALTLAKEYDRIAITSYHHPDDLLNTKELLTKLGIDCIAECGNCGDYAFVQGFVAKILQQWGQIDVLINNAGEYIYSDLDKMNIEDIQRLYQTNLIAPAFLASKVIPNMKNKKWGRIINIGSISGVMGEAYASIYSSSKAGLIGLTKALALELAEHNITVNTINPGWVETELGMASIDDSEFSREEIVETIPQRRFVKPEEVAKLCKYLISEDAKGITGQSINLCAGLSVGI